MRASLADYTTLRVGGLAQMITTETAQDLIRAVRDADEAEQPVLLVGGGSNLVVCDDPVPALAVRITHRGLAVDERPDEVVLDVAAGEDWDTLVARAVDEGWSGIECLSGIPGLLGATPVQNVGAYGAEVADVLESVDVWDRHTSQAGVIPAAHCGFGYRQSIFKYAARHVVLGVRLRLRRDAYSAPVRYAELARTLGVATGARVPLAEARAAVLALRRSKGMVLDNADHDTWSAGSFFTNPVIPAELVPPGAPAYPAEGGLVKTSAAWLIEHAGFTKGYGDGPARLSTKHTLAITNRGGASAADVLALARTIRDGVLAAYSIELRPEPLLIGCTL